MNNLKRYFIYFAIFFLGSFIVKITIPYIQQQLSINEAESYLEKNNSIQPTKTGQTKREAEIEAATNDASSMISKSSSDSSKLENAVNIFRGFYLINVAGRPKYCSQYNISIDSFVNGFKEKYSHEIKIMNDFEKNVQPVPPSMLIELNKLLDKQVKHEIESSSKEFNISIQNYCQSFELYAADYLKQIDLKSRSPEVYELLNKQKLN
jgi:hypothetical protein